MANNASAKKCIRQSERHRLHNRYYAKTTRNAIRDIRTTTDKKAAEEAGINNPEGSEKPVTESPENSYTIEIPTAIDPDFLDKETNDSTEE